MSEVLSPNPKQWIPSFPPTKTPFIIGSKYDKQERAAACRRNIIAPTSTDAEDPWLGKEHILEMFQYCIKIASENKINQKNAWNLNLIDHLSEIVKVEEANDSETNFQMASCALEAGVKIYSVRVDSAHSEAYKVLESINRVGRGDEQDEQTESKRRKDQDRKLSPLSTVESSFAALNLKKFDAAFAVDPLYHQTSAQFDEGGAKGLLLNNLGVYGNCRVLFDSLEVPGKCVSSAGPYDGTETIDLSFAKDCIEQLVLGFNKAEISPSLSEIVNQLDNDNKRPPEVYSPEQVDENVDVGDTSGNFESWDFDNDVDKANMVDGYDNQDPNVPNQPEADEQFNYQDVDEDDRFKKVNEYLFLNLGASMKQNLWAGPSHWKYRRAKDPENSAKENGSSKLKKTKNDKADSELYFSSAADIDISHIFAPLKNPKSLLLPANKAPCITKLPEDCHYHPENLVNLFSLPNVLCFGRRGRTRTDEKSQHTDGYEATASWDDEDGFGGAFEEGHAYSNNEEASTLVSQPRQINTIEAQYDKTSKQVDVHALKETLWNHIQNLVQSSVQEEASEETISFKHVMHSFPDASRSTASPNDISPHLCFICLLHLANEHGMEINGCETLDDLIIHLKPK